MSNIFSGPAQDRPLQQNHWFYHHIYGHERKQMRWADFDYSSQGVYFVTIVTNERRNLFGYVRDGEMRLNAVGRMVLEEYLSIETNETGVTCMDVVVMPNHIHCMVYLPNDSGKTIPVIMEHFKSRTVNRYCVGVKEDGWAPYHNHLWQRSYWDDIVRNERQFEFIRRYIRLNPQRWDKDAINAAHGRETDDINSCIKKLR